MAEGIDIGVPLAFDFTPVLIFLLAAVVVVPLFQRFRASPVLAYLAAGAVIGPYALGLIDDLEATRHIGEFGVIFLLFAIGLELSFNRLKAMRRDVFGLGTCQVALTGVLFGGGAYALGAGAEVAIVVGGALALSSTALVMQLLDEHGELNTRAGRTTFSILLLQDLAVVPLMVLVPLLAEDGHNIAAALGVAGLEATAALVGLTVLGRMILRPLYRVVAGTRNAELFVGTSLLIVLATSWATAQAGLSLALGAFLAGVLLSETEYVHQIEADIAPFRGLFLGLFFISVGMAVDVHVVLDQAVLVFAIVVALIVAKGAVIVALCRLFGLPLAPAVQIGFALANGGEFAFILFGLAVAVGIMPVALGQVLVVAVGLTMVAAPALTVVGRRTGKALARPEPGGDQALVADTADLHEHILVAGFGRVGQTVGRLLQDHSIPYIALDLDHRTVTEGRARGYPVYYGDAGRYDVLKAAGVGRARGAVITLDRPAAAMRAVEAIHRNCPHGAIIVRAHDRSHSETLKTAGAAAVVPEILESSLQLAGQTLRAAGVPLEVVQSSLEALRAEDYVPIEEIIAANDPESLDDKE